MKHLDPQFNVQHESGAASSEKILTRAARSKSATKVRPQKPAANKTAKPTRKPSRKNRSASKQDRVLALLRRPVGATLDVLIKATGWQQHSVRGFLAGMVRKKLKLPSRSEKVGGVRVYRVGGRHRQADTDGKRGWRALGLIDGSADFSE